MNIIQKVLELIGLRKKWICLKGRELKLITKYNDWNYGYTTRYKLTEGQYTKRNISEGTPGDDLYEVYTIFKPKPQSKILVWIKNKENKTTRYLVILNNKYTKKIIINK